MQSAWRKENDKKRRETPERKAYQREYYKKHNNSQGIYKKRDDLKGLSGKEYQRIYRKVYFKESSERKAARKEYHRTYQRKGTNSGELRISRADWRKEHSEEIKEYAKKWRKENREITLAAAARRRARKAQTGGSYTAKQWEELKVLYGYKCLCCQRTDVKLTADHVIPLSKGGTSNIENIQPLCQTCNLRKSAKLIDFRPINS